MKQKLLQRIHQCYQHYNRHTKASGIAKIIFLIYRLFAAFSTNNLVVLVHNALSLKLNIFKH